MDEFFLWGKNNKHFFQVPDTWQVLDNVILETEKVETPVYEMVNQSLSNPIGSPTLNDLVKPRDKVLILVDDRTRPTPRREIVSCLLDHLTKIGIGDEQIDILFALGTHRSLEEEEVKEELGIDVFQRIRVSFHDAWSEDLVTVGNLPHGGELKINPLAVKADIRISVGSVLPHPMNGFGGGAKTLMPGICNYEAIRDHHLATLIAKGTALGNLEGNTFRDEIRKAAELASLDFIINAIYDSKEEVKGIVSGHFDKAHEHGVELSLREYAVKVNQDADVSIVSTFPYDEGPQLIKPLGPGTMVTKKGGTVILFAARIVGGRIPDPLLDAFDHTYAQLTGDSARMAVDYLNRRKLLVPNAPMDFNCAIYLTLLYLSRVKVVLVAKDSDKDQAGRLGFDYSNSLADAIGKVSESAPHAKINILPSGGLIVPITEKELVFG
jgi:nickel-dependent lactate racemase